MFGWKTQRRIDEQDKVINNLVDAVSAWSEAHNVLCRGVMLQQEQIDLISKLLREEGEDNA